MRILFIMLPTTYQWGSRALWFKDPGFMGEQQALLATGPDGNIVDFYSKVKD